jgi:hypothetical protein
LAPEGKPAPPLPAPAARESEVEASLAQWGKPPREAIRALLDPSDENVAALLKFQADSVARARRLAERMTVLSRQWVPPAAMEGASTSGTSLPEARTANGDSTSGRPATEGP